jgi:hypothetical protein
MHIYTRAKRIARPKILPRTAPRMVFSWGSEPSGTAATAAPVGVWVAIGFVALAAREVVEGRDVDVELSLVDVAVPEVEEDSVERSRTWESLDSASSQLLSLALNMHTTSSAAVPPAITTMPSGPWARAKLLLVTFGAEVELYAGQLFTVKGSPALFSLLLNPRSPLLDDDRLRTGAAFGTGTPGPLNKTVLLTAFGDSDMSKVRRFLDPSSPVISTAWIADVSFGSGAASDAPESTHFLSAALKSITCAFHVLPPIKAASLGDHDSRIGFTDGGPLVS